MEKQAISAFLDGLIKMSSFFCDEMSELRQRLYWEVLRDDITLEEWRYACWQAMRHETVYKVPLPATLMAYVREGRRVGAAERARHAASAARRVVREDPLAQAQVQALIASVWPESSHDEARREMEPHAAP